MGNLMTPDNSPFFKNVTMATVQPFSDTPNTIYEWYIDDGLFTFQLSWHLFGPHPKRCTSLQPAWVVLRYIYICIYIYIYMRMIHI